MLKKLQDKLFRKKPLTVRSKLAIAFSLVIGLVALCVYIYLPAKIEQQATGAIVGQAQSIAEMTAYSVSPALFFDDAESMQDVLANAGQNEDLRYIVVTGAADSIIAAFNSDYAERVHYDSTHMLLSETLDEPVFKTVTPIVKNEQEIGQLYLGFSLEELHQEIQESRKTITIACLWLFLIGIIAVSAISAVVTKPLMRIVQTVDLIKAGDLSQRTDVRSNDEIGILANAFNGMVSKLERAYKDIEAANAGLHKRAAELNKEIEVRTKAENAFRRSQRKYRLLFNQIPDSIFIFDKETRKFLDCNRAVEAMYGYTKKELKEMTPFELHPPDEMERVRENIDLKNLYKPNLYRHITKNGKHLDVEIRTDQIDFQGQPAWLSIVSDVSKRKRAEAQQARLLAELESINHELKDFAYVVSHDLKAPLRGIGSLADWLLSDYAGQLDDEGKELIRLLNNRVNRMYTLIEGILQYSRVGRIREKMVAVDLNQVVREILGSLAPPDNIDIRVTGSLPTVLFEKTRLEQVFQNLLSNAIKYMDKPKGEISISCVSGDDNHTFGIKDNGPGIDKKHHAKIFQIFQTLRARDEFESTGVGLTLVKKIIEMYGGHVWVESEPGSGTTFFFTVPRETARLQQPVKIVNEVQDIQEV